MTDSLPPVELSMNDVFGQGGSELFFNLASWDHPVSYFVGRNGSGKSRVGKVLASRIPNTRFLSTDRLVGLMNFTTYTWGSMPTDYRGVPLDEESRPRIEELSRQFGTGTNELHALRQQPEVWLKVAAFLRRALNRSIELRESAGFLDPFVRSGSVEYSLLREEGHGLREIVILLTAVYRSDWSLLVVDEPELHLHPSLTRLWLSELEAECQRSSRHAVVITHEPSMIRPSRSDDLGAIHLFQPNQRAATMESFVEPGLEARVTASLVQNPLLVSQLVFSPRPVLLEGVLDVLAVNASLRRSQPSEVIAQTDLIDCGGNGGLAVWFSIARRAGLDVRAVGDLDCCLDPAVTSAIDRIPEITARYQSDLFMEPPRTSTVVRPLINAMREAGVEADQKSRAKWLADNAGVSGGNSARRDKLLEIWRDAGLWLHQTGTLESVLGLSEQEKSRDQVVSAASTPGRIDAVAAWAAYRLNPSGDVFALLSASIEHLAHSLLEALRLSPTERFDQPVGSTARADSRLASVAYLPGTGKHRITVKLPEDFAGYWVDVDRQTTPDEIVLRPPGAIS